MQIWAVLLDSYRLLMDRKLFLITLGISILVVLIYASIGFDDNGIFVLFGAYYLECEQLQAGSPWAEGLYLWIFSFVIVGLWLTWAATILALISTTPIFIDFMSDGAIDLVLSKPINRIRLFFFKYLGGLLFVLLQVGLFAVGVFLCIGWRLGQWNWSIFSAIPLVVVFFSYLYSVNVLLSILTRSALASLLLTLLFWLVLFCVQFAEGQLTKAKVEEEMAAGLPSRSADAENHSVRSSRNPLSQKAEEFTVWRDRVRMVLIPFPKTQETLGLLDRWITIDSSHSMDQLLIQGMVNSMDNNSYLSEMAKRMEAEYGNRSPLYIIGSSLGFEFVVLSFACFLFVRKDF
ncbi:MAG: ABC transporter permease subunit [Planctomycetes bacterium]|nr:ABC transporter permease subunit [Planctomycetota bacterium]